MVRLLSPKLLQAACVVGRDGGQKEEGAGDEPAHARHDEQGRNSRSRLSGKDIFRPEANFKDCFVRSFISTSHARYAPIAPWSNCSRENKALKWDRMYEMYLFTVHSTFFLRVLHDTQQTRNGMFHTLRRCSMTRYAEFSKVSLLAPLSMFVTHQSRNQRLGSISF